MSEKNLLKTNKKNTTKKSSRFTLLLRLIFPNLFGMSGKGGDIQMEGKISSYRTEEKEPHQ